MKEITNEYMEELEENYYCGMSDGVAMVKRIMELPRPERKQYFGDYDVARILDRLDFRQLHEILKRPELKPDKELVRYWVIKGIQNKSGTNVTCAISGWIKTKPSKELIEAFLYAHKEAEFAYVDKIYVRE